MMYNNSGNEWMTMPNSAAAPLATVWSRQDDMIFEKSLVDFADEPEDNRWRKIADRLPGKTPNDIKYHYEALLHDVYEIEAGRIDPPRYTDDSESFEWNQAETGRPGQISFGSGGHRTKNDVERKKGTPWTEDEHRLFLQGLEKYGKGDWRSISRNVVVTRTPTQVASHAQKYYLRQTAVKKERKRSSIHDITTAVDSVTVPPPVNLQNQAGFQNFSFPMPR